MQCNRQPVLDAVCETADVCREPSLPNVLENILSPTDVVALDQACLTPNIRQVSSSRRTWSQGVVTVDDNASVSPSVISEIDMLHESPSQTGSAPSKHAINRNGRSLAQ